MAETEDNHDSGSRDRATVALVDAKVDGIRELIKAEFGYIRERIQPIASLVTEQAQLKGQTEDHERRLQVLEGDRKSDREWKRVNLPSLVIAASVALGGIVATLTQLHII